MYLLMMAAQVLGRSYDSINALSLATLIVLFLNPQASVPERVSVFLFFP